MRYRLMASYLGASYQAAVGPSDRDVTLFAAPPPPEEHGFSPAPGGIWRKQVSLDDLDGLWESRPIGSYHGEPCLVLDDLGDRLTSSTWAWKSDGPRNSATGKLTAACSRSSCPGTTSPTWPRNGTSSRSRCCSPRCRRRSAPGIPALGHLARAVPADP